uniref:Uncharacterized protein n=1 Tax=Strigamia maritima TaxID=126957 RepID=T1IX50_STRMM
MLEKIPDVSSCNEKEFLDLARMQDLPLAEEMPSTSRGVQILLGLDYYWDVYTGKNRHLTRKSGLMQTVFGWTISGVLRPGKNLNQNVVATMHETEPNLEELWELEKIKISGDEKDSDFVRKEFKDTMKREPDGRYSVTIPFNEKIEKLESNWDSAVTIADVKQAFLQVLIQKEYRDVLRFLWVTQEFFEKPYSWDWVMKCLRVFRMKVIPFGLNSSLFLLCAVIRKQASLKSSEFEKEADSLDSGMYMET